MSRTAVFGFYLALSIAFTAPVSLHPSELAVNDGDPLHISWILAWDAHQMVRDPVHLFDSNSFYPYPSSLAFSEHLLGPALLAAPFFYATGNALFAQNAAVILTLALSAFALFLLFREVFGSEIGALVAGTVYGFHSYNFHEVARLQLLSVQWWPLAALYLHRTFVRGGARNAFLAAFFFTLQGLSCTYYLFYFALALLIWIPVYALASDEGLRRAATLVAPFAASGTLFALVGIPYLRMVRGFGFARGLAEGTDLGEYLRPPAGSLFGSVLAFDTPASVVPQFLGFVALSLAALGIMRRRFEDAPRSRVVFFWLSVSTAIVGGVLSLGPTLRAFGVELGPGPYGFLYDALPFFRVLRNAERMSVLVHFGLAVGAGVGAEALSPGRILRILLLVALPFEHFTGGQPFTRVPTGELVPEVYRWLGERSGKGAVVELPLYPREKLRLHALYMFYSTVHWKPIVFGRTSFYPPLTGYLGWEMRRFPDADSIALLEGLSVETLVVHPSLWPKGERERKLALLQGFADRLEPQGRFGPAVDPSQERYGFGDERVFRLRHAGEKPSTSDLCTPEGEIPPEGWTLRGESGESDRPVSWIVDRNPETKWRTSGQLPGLKLEIDLGREESLSAARLELGYPHDQFPRDVTLKVRTEGGAGFERIDHRDDVATRWELVEALVEAPSSAAVTLRFPRTKARVLRFWIREGKEWDYSLPDWSLPELRLYRECGERH